LLAQKVLRGQTKGYKHHPQLVRFSRTNDPPAAVAAYLAAVLAEAQRRSYHFDATKIGRPRMSGRMTETRGQLSYEWRHLQRKLKQRAAEQYRASLKLRKPSAHPLFRIVSGKVRDWEKT
jgi:hypothetical protein